QAASPPTSLHPQDGERLGVRPPAFGRWCSERYCRMRGSFVRRSCVLVRITAAQQELALRGRLHPRPAASGGRRAGRGGRSSAAAPCFVGRQAFILVLYRRWQGVAQPANALEGGSRGRPFTGELR